jgi:AraC family transcriptional regulator
MASTGQVVIWPGRAIYVGQLLENEAHAHQAIQVSIALDSALRLQADPDPRWSTYRAVATASDRTHRLQCDGRIAQVYVDPESTAGLALRQWMGETTVRSIDRDDIDTFATALRSACREPSDPGRLLRIAEEIPLPRDVDF